MRELIRRIIQRAVLALVAALPLTLAAAGPAAPSAPEVGCASLEGCYSYEEMDDFLVVARELVFDFALEEYAPQVFWVDLRYVAEGESGESLCWAQEGVRARYTDSSYEYCPADNTIYIGQRTLWSFYSEIGDVAPIVGLAHEFGHFLQTLGDIPAPETPEESVHHENQADCFAGAWFDHADREGLLELPDDEKDIDQILDRIGSSEDERDRTHGTAAERKQSFEDGRVGGLVACNGYYPATPLQSEEQQDLWRSLLSDLRRSASRLRKSRPREHNQ